MYSDAAAATETPSQRARNRLNPPDYASLRKIDWTFPTAVTQQATHAIHPYPAKFIPQIPRELLRVLHPHDQTAVLDPFCGSGTTLVEAALAGVRSVGIDVNPLACLITKVKLTPIAVSLQHHARLVVTEASEGTPVPPPPIPRLDHWFQPNVQRVLSALVTHIDRIAETTVRDALRVSLASIIVRVSNQESDTRYAAVQKEITEADVLKAFLAATRKTELAISRTWGPLFRPPVSEVINHDVLAIDPAAIPAPVSLVITSPPYPNAYEYWLYHKYRMYWLGMDPQHVRDREIGARLHYFKRNPQTPEDFERQMGTVFSLVASVMIRRGHACFQIGDSVIKGTLVDNAAIIDRAADKCGFTSVLRLEREIPPTRKAFNARFARIRREKILVYRADNT